MPDGHTDGVARRVFIFLAVLALIFASAAVSASYGPSPEVHAYSTNASASGTITGVNGVGGCMFAEGEYHVEVHLTEDAYSDHDVREVKLLDDGKVISTSQVDVEETVVDDLCAPLGESEVVTVSSSGEVVDRTTLTIEKVPVEELKNRSE